MRDSTLRDGAGRPLATYAGGTCEGRPLADYVLRGADVGEPELVAAILGRLGGWIVGTTDLGLAAALEAAGARRRRFGHALSLDLARTPRFRAEPPPGTDIEPLREITDDLGAANAAAYAPGHPDHRGEDPADSAAELRRIARGEEVGPLLPASRVAVHGGRQAGAAIVTDSGGEPPEGGPWLAELFRAPGAHLAGLGAALLAAAIAAARADGLATLGLVVSDGIPARRLYERAGFRRASSAVTLWIPAQGSPGG